MRGSFIDRLSGLAVALLLGCAGATTAQAQQRPWPSSTNLPRPAPAPVAPPAVLERAPSATAAEHHVAAVSADRLCASGMTCVVCVAACDGRAPKVLQALKPRPTGAIVTQANLEANLNDSDGVSALAPDFARPSWAGITCGQISGCYVANVSPPPRSRDTNITVTLFGPYAEQPNRYIDR